MFKTFKRVKQTLQNTQNIIKKEHTNSLSQIAQKQLFSQLVQMKSQNCLPSFTDMAFKHFSQFDEDGILLYIFAVIGFTNKYCLDIAFAAADGANTTNLILNWGFGGTLVCGDEAEKQNASYYFKNNSETWLVQPNIVASWVTTKNICNTLEENGVPISPDFLSLDMDGVDYWILQAIMQKYSPRVVCVESQNIWKDLKSTTVPYDENFCRFDHHEDFFGTSPLAFVKIFKNLGYKLVAHNKYGFNLFFIKNDEINNEYLSEIEVKDILSKLPDYYLKQLDERRKAVENYGWIEI